MGGKIALGAAAGRTRLGGKWDFLFDLKPLDKLLFLRLFEENVCGSSDINYINIEIATRYSVILNLKVWQKII